MKNLSKVVLGLAVVVLLFIVPMAVIADDTATITITARPRISGGITNFQVTAVSESEIDFSWGYESPADRIMIRGKVGGYPDPITDPNVAPSDGYLVYYGNATEATDVRWAMESVTKPVYYAAWAQRDDGVWYIDESSTWMENTILLLVGLGIFLVIGLCLTIAAISKRSGMLSYGAVGAWVLTAFQAFYCSASSSPSQITDAYMGLFWMCIAFAIALGVWPYASRERPQIAVEEGEEEWEGEDLSSFFGQKKEQTSVPRRRTSRFAETGRV